MNILNNAVAVTYTPNNFSFHLLFISLPFLNSMLITCENLEKRENSEARVASERFSKGL
jgi:hypothetical protein